MKKQKLQILYIRGNRGLTIWSFETVPCSILCYMQQDSQFGRLKLYPPAYFATCNRTLNSVVWNCTLHTFLHATGLSNRSFETVPCILCHMQQDSQFGRLKLYPEYFATCNRTVKSVVWNCTLHTLLHALGILVKASLLCASHGGGIDCRRIHVLRAQDV
jgi:hypothetical protein